MLKYQNSRLGTTSTIVNGAAVLGIAAIISKLLGTLQKIPMQNIGGDEAYGIYNAVFPFYTLILFLATAGFPIAVSKFVSEYAAENNLAEARRVLRVSSVILSVTGILCFVVLFFGADWIALMIGNGQTKLAIQSVSFALILVPVMAALRGYFQGLQNMVPTGSSQVIEQFVRVCTMVVLLLYFTSLDLSEDWIAAGATFGSVTGACVGLWVMLIYWRKHRAKQLKAEAEIKQDLEASTEIEWVPPESLLRKKAPLSLLIRKLMLYALPICLGAIVVPILSIVDTFTMPRMLKLNGLTESEAMVEFGLYARGLPLVQLVAMLFSSLSVALVPAIAEAKFKRDLRAIHVRTELSIRFTWLIGGAASVGLALMVVPLNVMFFKNDLGSVCMSILAFTAVFSALNIISASILQGLGAVIIPAISLLCAAVVKVILNLTWIPYWGIEGAASSAVVTFFIAAIFNMIAIKIYTGFSFPMQQYLIRPFAALAVMGAALFLWIQGLQAVGEMLSLTLAHRGFATFVALTGVIWGAAVYLVSVFWVGAISIKDLNHIPSVGRKLIPLLQKLKIGRSV